LWQGDAARQRPAMRVNCRGRANPPTTGLRGKSDHSARKDSALVGGRRRQSCIHVRDHGATVLGGCRRGGALRAAPEAHATSTGTSASGRHPQDRGECPRAGGGSAPFTLPRLPALAAGECLGEGPPPTTTAAVLRACATRCSGPSSGCMRRTRTTERSSISRSEVSMSSFAPPKRGAPNALRARPEKGESHVDFADRALAGAVVGQWRLGLFPLAPLGRHDRGGKEPRADVHLPKPDVGRRNLQYYGSQPFWE
jgi:hypothetical protein